MMSKKLRYIIALVVLLSSSKIQVNADENIFIDNNQNYTINKEANENNTSRIETRDNMKINTGWVSKDGKWFYFDDEGNNKIGWLQWGSSWYYLNVTNGQMETGLISNNGNEYYLNNEGIMQTGWQQIENKWYFFEGYGAMKKGWFHNNGYWYLLKADGTMATQWETDNGIRYYFENNGVMQVGWKQINGSWYYLQGSGAMQIGWLYEGGNWYYLKNSGIMSTSFENIDGTNYYMNSSGVMQKGWQNIDGNWYYLHGSGAMQKGWLNDRGTWYYLKDNGVMATSWENIEGTYYYMNSSGVMQTGWQSVSGVWYYLEGSGAMKTGWFNDRGNWYYLKSNGAMATDWQKVGESYYYLGTNGIMQTDWKAIDGKWYYMDGSGAMKIGWVTLSGKTYFFESDGVMVSDWHKYNDAWYYFDSSGAQQKGLIKIKGKDYYLDESTGKRASYEWKTINGKAYWFNSNGTLATDDTIIDGKMNLFDSTGRYLGIGEIKEQLHIEILSVGDADAIYIELPNGDDVLIDAGEYKDGQRVVEFLKGRNLAEDDGVEDIDYIVNTHPHSDHIGGLVDVFKNFKINNLYYPYDIEMKKYDGFEGAESTENHGYLINCMNYCYQFYSEVLEQANIQGTKIHDTISGSYIDESKILKFVHPNKTYSQNNLDKLGQLSGYDYCLFNNDSAVIYADYGDFQMLLAGDIEGDAENDMIKMGLIPSTDIEVLKIAHHGFTTSSLYGFLEKVSPEFGVMSRTKFSQENSKDTYVTKNLRLLQIDEIETWTSNSVKIDATKKTWNIFN